MMNQILTKDLFIIACEELIIFNNNRALFLYLSYARTKTQLTMNA
jgi:hypothetical protein